MLDIVKYQSLLESYYTPLCPHVYHFSRHHLQDHVAQCLSDEKHLHRLTYCEQKNILGLPLFNKTFCEDLVAELKNLEYWHERMGLDLPVANSMHSCGFALQGLGFDGLLDNLLRRVVSPLAAKHFSTVGGQDLCDYHAFIVRYQPGEQQDLNLHVDASNVTLNICLSQDFAANELQFFGERCAEHLDDDPLWFEQYTFYHQQGKAVMHTGMQRHAAEPIRAGERYSLILWCRSSSVSFFHNTEEARVLCPCDH